MNEPIIAQKVDFVKKTWDSLDLFRKKDYSAYMRKLLLLLLFMAGCSFSQKEEKFVNPLFYKKMQPYNSNSWETKITPTSLTISHLGKTLHQSCFLVENTINKVVLNCESILDPEMPLPRYWNPDEREIETFTIQKSRNTCLNGYLIKHTKTSSIDSSFSRESFCVEPNNPNLK